MHEDIDQSLIGAISTVMVPISADRPGEVVLAVRGGTEAFATWADEPIARHTRVVIVECTTNRSLTVTPCP